MGQKRVIKTPVRGYDGIVAGVRFVDGEGRTDDQAALQYFERHGYGIGADSTPEDEHDPELPKDVTDGKTAIPDGEDQGKGGLTEDGKQPAADPKITTPTKALANSGDPLPPVATDTPPAEDKGSEAKPATKAAAAKTAAK